MTLENVAGVFLYPKQHFYISKNKMHYVLTSPISGKCKVRDDISLKEI